MRTYERRPNMERVPYGQKAKHPERTAEYQIKPRRQIDMEQAVESLRDVADKVANAMEQGAASDEAELRSAIEHIIRAQAALSRTSFLRGR